METETLTHAEETVGHLIEVCHDGQQGFESAADAISEATLRLEFQRYGRQCGQFITDLERELRRLGHTPPTHGTITGVLRRGWMHLAAVITRGDEHAILSACLRAQAAAVDAYERAVISPLPAELQELVAAQHRVFAGIHNRIRSLCDMARMS